MVERNSATSEGTGCILIDSVRTARMAAGRECIIFCCEKEFLPKHYAETEGLAFLKVISTLQLSPAILKELRMALSRRKKESAVLAWSRSSAPGGVVGTPNEHQDSLRASAKPTRWEARATHPSPQTGVQRLAKSPRLLPQVYRQSRANKLHLAAGNSVRPRVGRSTRLS